MQSRVAPNTDKIAHSTEASLIRVTDRRSRASTTSNKAKELWWSTLPAKIKQLPHGVFITGLVLQLLLLTAFCLLAAYEYADNISTQYISPSQDNPRCRRPAKTISGTYKLGTDGLWDTSTSFDALKALYKVEFTDYSDSEVVWEKQHAPDLYSEVVSLNASMKNRPLATNLLWMLTKKVSLVEDTLSVTLLADPVAMLGRTAMAAKLLYTPAPAFNNYASNCSGVMPGGPPSSTLYASATSLSSSGSLSMTFDATSLSATGYSSAFIQASNLASSSSTTSTVAFDLRSAIVAAAVNNGQLALGDLEKIKAITTTKGLYYLLKYEGMTPITCTTKTAVPVCNVVVGSTEGAMLPLLMHRNNYEKMVNTSSTLPRCTCQVSASSCDEWDVMLMMVHKDGCFVTKQDTTPEAYYTGGYNVLAVNLYSLSTYVNEYYMSLPKIHCQGPLLLTSAPQDSENFRSTAPADLVESYWICGYTKYTIWSNTISSAWANTDLIKEVLIVLLLVAAVYAIRFKHKVEVKFKRDHVEPEELWALAERVRRLEAMQPGMGAAQEADGSKAAQGMEDGTNTNLFHAALA